MRLAHAQEVSDSGVCSPCPSGARGVATRWVVGFHGYLHANYLSRPDSTSLRARSNAVLFVAEGAETPTPILWEDRLEHVVDGNHSDYVLFLIHYRQCGEVEVGQLARHLR